MSIKKITLFAILLFTMCLTTEAQKRDIRRANIDTEQWRYEIECVGPGLQGTYLVKAWTYSRKPQIAIEQAKKNAVHGIIFRGYAGGSQGCNTQKPLMRDPYVEKEFEQFFRKFFRDGGRYMKFVSLSTDSQIAAEDRLRLSKKEYKIGVIVSVRKDELRKELEDAGVIKKMTSGF